MLPCMIYRTDKQMERQDKELWTTLLQATENCHEWLRHLQESPWRERERERGGGRRERERETERETETETETETDRDRQRERETDRETERQRQTERQTETERVHGHCACSASTSSVMRAMNVATDLVCSLSQPERLKTLS